MMNVMTSRRGFIQSVAVFLAALVSRRYLGNDSPRGTLGSSPSWERLRRHWLDLEGLVVLDWEEGRAEVERRGAAHRATLDELVAAGEIEPAVAEHVQMAFLEAAEHIRLSRSLVTCYDMSQLGSVQMNTREDLVRQQALLVEFAQSGALDEAAVQQAWQAIERDIVFLDEVASLEALSGEARWQAESRLLEQFESFQLEGDPAAIEAARLLVDLLLGQRQ
jgi:hypothetical protein